MPLMAHKRKAGQVLSVYEPGMLGASTLSDALVGIALS